MFKKKKIIILPLFLFFFSCKKSINNDEIYRIGTEKCASIAQYVTNLKYKPDRTVFTTYISNIKGVSLVELPMVTTDTANYKIYQHETWKKYGHMGSLTTGRDGSIYTAPVPVINTLDRPLSKMNMLFKIAASTGRMEPFIDLPSADTSPSVVPYAILGVYYDCHSDKVFAASVAGSTSEKQNGVIYTIDPSDGQISDQLKGYDAMGLYVCGISGTKRLYFGSARNSNIYSIELDADGEFVGEPIIEFSLEQKGPRGDDKARRMRLNKQGNMIIYGVEFNYNLTANTVVPQSTYQFDYVQSENKWIFNHVE